MTVVDHVRISCCPSSPSATSTCTTSSSPAGLCMKVVVDRPRRPSTSTCSADATRAVSRALDEADPIGGAYTLEVTSPGLERQPAHAPPLRPGRGRDRQGQAHARRPGTPEAASAGSRARSPRPTTTASRCAPESGDERLAYDDIERAHTVFEWGPAPKPGKGRRPTPAPGRAPRRPPPTRRGTRGHERDRDDGCPAGARRREGHLRRHAHGRARRRPRVGLQAHARRARVRVGDDRPHQLRHPRLRAGDRRGRRARTAPSST